MIIKEKAGPLHILITGGRAPVALELSRRFAAAGHRVFAAESVDRHLCRVSRSVIHSYKVSKPNEDEAGYWNAIRSIALDQCIDIIIPTCEEVFHLAKGKALIETDSGCVVFCDSLDVLDQLHHKGSFIERVASHGMLTPLTRVVESTDQLSRLIREEVFSGKLVLKPAYSRFAAKVQMVELSKFETWIKSDAWHKLITPSTPWVAQQYIDGKALCAYSVVHAGGVTAHAAYAPAYTAGVGAGIYFEAVENDEVLKWVGRFAALESLTGQMSFDFIQTEDGRLFPIECNPRATSGVHLFPEGDELVQSIVKPDKSRSPLLAEAERSSMLALAMLLFGTKELLFPKRWKAWVAAFFGSRDVVYRRDDPAPLWEQLLILIETWKTAHSRNLSLLEAATIDLEWNGER